MRKLILSGAIALGLALSGSVALAADGAALYKAKCQACHGPDGKGSAMAPAFVGNAYIKSTAEDAIGKVITGGREGAAKTYKNFALGMPKQALNADETKAVVAYLKTLAGK